MLIALPNVTKRLYLFHFLLLTCILLPQFFYSYNIRFILVGLNKLQFIAFLLGLSVFSCCFIWLKKLFNVTQAEYTWSVLPNSTLFFVKVVSTLFFILFSISLHIVFPAKLYVSRYRLCHFQQFVTKIHTYLKKNWNCWKGKYPRFVYRHVISFIPEESTGTTIGFLE